VIAAELAVRNIGLLATLRGPTPRIGPHLRDIGAIPNAALAAADGRIVWVGGDHQLQTRIRVPPEHVLDCAGAAVIPGFVDAHTHLAFAGNRDDEIVRRLAGASYKDIAAAGGGIVRSVEATRAASLEELTAAIARHLDEMLLCGTTTAEVKSGYGLETRAELRSLEAIDCAAQSHPVTVVGTFLGAHEVPLERREDRERYIDEVVAEMIPEIARRRLARFCDVFCEEGVFTIDESRRVLAAARDRGLELRVHADELVWTGGAELAAEMGARSADHLIFVSDAGMAALAAAGCAATLLPSAAFYLRLGRFAPARALVSAGVPLALGTDVNPGAGLSPSMTFAMGLACFGMGLSLEEALAAATIGGAYSVGREAEVGSIEVGKRADLLVLRSERLLDLIRVGAPAVKAVVKNGRVVVRDGVRLFP
jgi:imidazolonepropionase